MTEAEIRQRLRMGEDSECEFRQVEFSGNRPKRPRRDKLADEMAAFANSNGGYLLCGVSDEGRVQGMSMKQMAALDQLLVEISTDTKKPALGIETYHREIDGQALVVVKVPRGDSVYERAGKAFIRVGGSSGCLIATNGCDWRSVALKVDTAGSTDRLLARRGSIRWMSSCGCHS